MELRQIIQFVALAETRNFRRAAEQLHMAQPPLSQAIRRLERDLDVRLFDRTSRSVELTEAGKVFLDESRRILAQLDSAVLLTQRTAQGRAGKLSVSFTVPWAYEVVPAILRDFRALHPNVVLTLHEAWSAEQVQGLLTGSLDVGFVRLPGRYEAKGIEHIALRHDRLCVIVPPEHPLGDAKALSLKDLQGEEFILPPFRVEQGKEQFSFRMQITSLCIEAGYSPRIAQEASQMQTIVHLVEAGLGISLIPTWTSRHFSSRAIYRDLVCDSDLCRVTLAAAWKSTNPSVALTRFIETISGAPN